MRNKGIGAKIFLEILFSRILIKTTCKLKIFYKKSVNRNAGLNFEIYIL